jgi:uncharacterized damage-inducible protein DinB
LPKEEYNALGCSGHGSIRETLAHMLQAQWGWFCWFDGSLPPEEAYVVKLSADDIPDAASAFVRWQEIDKQTHACINNLNDEKMKAEWSWSMPNGSAGKLPLGEMILHVVNHTIHTRAQIISAIRRTGRAPGVYEYLWYALSQQK